MASAGSGAPGGVFTPSLFMGAGAGLLYGTAVHEFWPLGAPNPIAFALVGMGAFLAADAVRLTLLLLVPSLSLWLVQFVQ